MSVFPDMYASLGLLPLSRCWVALSTPVLATAKWVSTSFRSTRSSSVAEPERHRRKTHSDIKCGHRPTLPLVYWYNYKVGPVYPHDTYLQVFNCLSLSLSLCSLLVWGNCRDSSSKLDQLIWVHRAKEQVGVWSQILCCTGKGSIGFRAKKLKSFKLNLMLKSIIVTIFVLIFLQSLNFSCSGCKHRLGSYWPPLEVCLWK